METLLIPELKMQLAVLQSIKNKLMYGPYDSNVREHINRLDGMISSLEQQIVFLEG